VSLGVWGRARLGGTSQEQLLSRNVQRFRGGLVFKAHRLCALLNSRLASNKEEEEGHLEEPLSSEEGTTYWFEDFYLRILVYLVIYDSG